MITLDFVCILTFFAQCMSLCTCMYVCTHVCTVIHTSLLTNLIIITIILQLLQSFITIIFKQVLASNQKDLHLPGLLLELLYPDA